MRTKKYQWVFKPCHRIPGHLLLERQTSHWRKIQEEEDAVITVNSQVKKVRASVAWRGSTLSSHPFFSVHYLVIKYVCRNKPRRLDITTMTMTMYI